MPDGRPVRILHAHSTFALGGKEARAVRLMNAFGDAAEHVVLNATDQWGALDAVDPGISVARAENAPSLTGRPGLGRYRALARYMRGFDLVLTYNWGAMDAVMARRLLGGPPLVHHEDGFNEDEAVRRKPIRNRFRRLALPAAHRLVVPSGRLEAIATAEWRQPARRLVRLPNGIDLARFQQPPGQPIPGLDKRAGEVVVGTVAGLRAVKNLPRLVRVFAAAAPPGASLVIVGDGPERARIEAEARAAGIADRLVMPGFMADPAAWIGHFDIFALSSDSEQQPISLIEAMAAGLPAMSTAVGDVADMVSDENRFAIGGEDVLRSALARFIDDPALRGHVGAANRVRALADFDERDMIARYAGLYGEAIGRPDAFGRPRL
ncbi:glycosyltransferase family 4 protein [Sphingosinicella sp. YJ22]|uniref:glycosyltransferase family 4 protein n=1 Tax=Sphingosinicella sp. YJ22 TaxID=1104780 RepID=UPI001FAFD58E|nr:glycosyltransferase family 4 protein [Sphingosinicella sp. YJ22]